MDEDAQFFAQHPDRYAHIRLPRLAPHTDPRSRQTRMRPECEAEFGTLGEHRMDRRRILLWRVPRDHSAYDPERPQILKIPFLLFAYESVEDTDAVLLPVIDGIMRDAVAKYGVRHG